MAKFIKEIAFGDNTLILETGEVARQADGAVFASMNGTQVLATVVGKKECGENSGFFPLTVNYIEKFSSSKGKAENLTTEQTRHILKLYNYGNNCFFINYRSYYLLERNFRAR